MNISPHRQCRRSGAFTLIEIMVVVGIIAIVMGLGVPAIFSSLKKDVMRQAVSDLIEGCAQARANAIISGLPTELVFQPEERSFSVQTAAVDLPSDPPSARSAPGFSRQYSDELILEMLSVNFQELKDAESARVRFYPNGTCDEFTIVLQWPRGQAFRKISLDIMTGIADAEAIR